MGPSEVKRSCGWVRKGIARHVPASSDFDFFNHEPNGMNRSISEEKAEKEWQIVFQGHVP